MPRVRPRVSSRPSRGADLADEWKGGLPCAWPVTEDIKMPTHYPLAIDEARYQGEGVAVVVAESRALAKDAAELVEVDYEPLAVDGRRQEGARRRRAARALRLRVRTSATSGSWRRTMFRPAIDAADVVVDPALCPAAADTECDRAARGARAGGPDRRRHACGRRPRRRTSSASCCNSCSGSPSRSYA